MGYTRFMLPKESRDIADDMHRSPFTELKLHDQLQLRNMCGREIMTFADYLMYRERFINREKVRINKFRI